MSAAPCGAHVLAVDATSAAIERIQRTDVAQNFTIESVLADVEANVLLPWFIAGPS